MYFLHNAAARMETLAPSQCIERHALVETAKGARYDGHLTYMLRRKVDDSVLGSEEPVNV